MQTLRITQGIFLLCLLTGANAGAVAGQHSQSHFERPAGLERDIAFWRHIYTAVDSQQGVIHDSRHLDIIYETVQFQPLTSQRVREKRTDARKKHYQDALLKLAGGQRASLTDFEQRVLSLWPDDVSPKDLRSAAKRLRCQIGQADRFRDGLARSGAWLPYIHRELRRHDMPPELAVLPHVESSFNAKAWSHAGAAGLWQITRTTGRHYLRIDHVIDERLDPYASTDAALLILRQNRRSTGTWPLAITAYNHGPGGMRRAAKKYGTHDIETIVRQYRSRSFGFASRNFYVAFLAATEVVKGAEGFFGETDIAPPEVTHTVTLSDFVPASALVRAFGVSQHELRSLNPSLSRSVWGGEKRVPRGFVLRLPRRHTSYENALAGLDASDRFDRQVRDDIYKVRRGDTLSVVARRFGLSAGSIVRANGLKSAHRIRVGQVLRLPTPDKTSASVRTIPRSEGGNYVVRSGDTLSHIARRFGLSEGELAGINSLADRHRIFPGQVLAVASNRSAGGNSGSLK